MAGRELLGRAGPKLAAARESSLEPLRACHREPLGGGGGSEDASALSRHSAAAQGEPEPSSRHHHHSRGTITVSPGMSPRPPMENPAGPCPRPEGRGPFKSREGRGAAPDGPGVTGRRCPAPVGTGRAVSANQK